MTSDSNRQRLFRRMLAREAGTDADVPAIAAAARRACERFANHLAPLIGDAGMAAICARSLHLTERNVPGVAPVCASAQGSSRFAVLQQFLEQQEPAAATEAAVAVLATSGELLASFIGDGLTNSLLREMWPEDFAGEATEQTLQ